jgi:translation elongation factor EF-G
VLEPMMRLEVVVPVEYLDDVRGNLRSRRGRILSVNGDAPRVIDARVPLAEMFGYSTDLRSRTLGRASYSMQFDSYQPVPGDPGMDDGDRDSRVTAPLKPPLRGGRSAIALPEPADDQGGPE